MHSKQRTTHHVICFTLHNTLSNQISRKESEMITLKCGTAVLETNGGPLNTGNSKRNG